MSQIYTFHETSIGHLHILNHLSCEDASASFSAENGKYHLAAVADGHGSKSCYRSATGAKAAVEVAMECMKQFAEAMLLSRETEDRFYKDILSERYRQMTIRHLTDTILKGWYDRISEDYRQNPPTAAEMDGNVPPAGASEELDSHIYGTTLIAALQLAGCLILLQQGDGRCEVFFRNGIPEQPIPWDGRCQDNATTSLCDQDAKESFRNCIVYWDNRHKDAVSEEQYEAEAVQSYGNGVIRFSRTPVMACYLGTDGVEDAYRDTYEDIGGSHSVMGGVHTFYKDLTCQIANMEPAAFESHLEKWLPDFSANGKFGSSGSGDDVSVAGIVDLDSLLDCTAQFQKDVEIYQLEEQLFWKEDQLRSKQRKHSILQKRLNEAEKSLADAEKYREELGDTIERRKKERDTCSEQITDKERELEYFNDDFQRANQMEWKSQLFSDDILGLMGNLSTLISRREMEYNNLKKDLSGYDDLIEREETLQSEMKDKIADLEERHREAKSSFDEYDSVYREIERERDQIKEEIRKLQAVDEEKEGTV